MFRALELRGGKAGARRRRGEERRNLYPLIGGEIPNAPPPLSSLKTRLFPDRANGAVGLPKTVLMGIPKWAGAITILTRRAIGGYASKREAGGVKTVRNVKESNVTLR